MWWNLYLNVFYTTIMYSADTVRETWKGGERLQKMILGAEVTLKCFMR